MYDALPRLKARREELLIEVSRLQGQLAAFTELIALYEAGEPVTPDAISAVILARKRLAPLGLVKSTVLRLIADAQPQGLTTREIVKLATVEGIKLNASSVSSLLSALRKDGVCTYKSGRYA